MKQLALILHESFSSILENHPMIVRPDLQRESPYFHGLWFYFYLSGAQISLVGGLTPCFKSPV